MTTEQALNHSIQTLMSELKPEGHWVGELSSSALAGAVAIIALHLNGAPSDVPCIQNGLNWLVQTQNADGGWGDCPKSVSNASTTLLVLSAFRIVGKGDDDRALAYLRKTLGHDIAAGIHQVYGDDHTFSVPILTTCAIAGLVTWDSVPRLPYAFAAMPYQLYNLLKLQVVSYALPALIAVGLAIDKQRGQSRIGRLVEKKVLGILETIQPESGGYLEAVPLTAFVSMSLLAMNSEVPLNGPTDSPTQRVLTKALAFLRRLQRPDGSWPIDANLAMWVTSGSINALRQAGIEAPESALNWLKENQTKDIHPFTHAEPGGWGWTNLSGSVPDGDDTSAALLALSGCTTSATTKGLHWLFNLQNADGGWPPFCRGWGRLPFDQSCTDITAHALRAIRSATAPVFPLLAEPESGSERAVFNPNERSANHIEKGFKYLATVQRGDGSWSPLWFGSQLTRSNDNPVFGTSRVLLAYADYERKEPARDKGIEYLLRAQNKDGGWGAAVSIVSSLQETSLALSALSCYRTNDQVNEAVERGLVRLISFIEQDGLNDAQPIGLYFAKLWYSEKLYPMIWAVEALARCTKTN